MPYDLNKSNKQYWIRMTSELVKRNEKIKVGMFLSMLSVLLFMLSTYLAYFYYTEPQRVLRGDSASFIYIAIAIFFSVTSFVVALKAMLNTYRNIMG